MTIPPVTPGTAVPAGRATAANPPSAENPDSSRQALQQQQNLAILQAHHSISLSTSNQPLSLAFQTAIDAINKELEPSLGERAIERGVEQGLDVSPQATADRIVSLTTGMFGRFQEHRPELSESEQAEKFIALIRSGIDQGFAEAREILDGLKVLEGDIAANIDRTYALVQEGLDAFQARFEPPATDD